MSREEPTIRSSLPSLRIAAFGIRTLPPSSGAAGADTFASELYKRLAKRGHQVTAYCRQYPSDDLPVLNQFEGIRLIHIRTVKQTGFDTLLHSFKSTMHIILRNTGDVVHIHNGGNSIWAVVLRLFGKQVFVSQDGVDWKRDKWPWYARSYLRLSAAVTAWIPNAVIFDNIYAQQQFEELFGRRRFFCIPYGADFPEPTGTEVLDQLNLIKDEYFLFIGRFIPDKGIHYLIEAFEKVDTKKQLIIIGGSPNPGSDYELKIRATRDPRIRFLGYIYGREMLQVMAGAFCYVQPSDVEGLSPVLLTAMGFGKPMICSNIKENLFAVADTALTFEAGSPSALRERLQQALQDPGKMQLLGQAAKERALKTFSWETVTEQHLAVFSNR